MAILPQLDPGQARAPFESCQDFLNSSCRNLHDDGLQRTWFAEKLSFGLLGLHKLQKSGRRHLLYNGVADVPQFFADGHHLPRRETRVHS
jgi:hypothetical protein